MWHVLWKYLIRLYSNAMLQDEQAYHNFVVIWLGGANSKSAPGP